MLNVQRDPRPKHRWGRGQIDTVGPQVVAAALEASDSSTLPRIVSRIAPGESRFPSRYETLAKWQQAVERCPSTTSGRAGRPSASCGPPEKKLAKWGASGYSGRRCLVENVLDLAALGVEGRHAAGVARKVAALALDPRATLPAR